MVINPIPSGFIGPHYKDSVIKGGIIPIPNKTRQPWPWHIWCVYMQSKKVERCIETFDLYKYTWTFQKVLNGGVTGCQFTIPYGLIATPCCKVLVYRDSIPTKAPPRPPVQVTRKPPRNSPPCGILKLEKGVVSLGFLWFLSSLSNLSKSKIPYIPPWNKNSLLMLAPEKVESLRDNFFLLEFLWLFSEPLLLVLGRVYNRTETGLNFQSKCVFAPLAHTMPKSLVCCKPWKELHCPFDLLTNKVAYLYKLHIQTTLHVWGNFRYLYDT